MSKSTLHELFPKKNKPKTIQLTQEQTDKSAKKLTKTMNKAKLTLESDMQKVAISEEPFIPSVKQIGGITHSKPYKPMTLGDKLKIGGIVGGLASLIVGGVVGVGAIIGHEMTKDTIQEPSNLQVPIGAGI